MPAPEEGHVLLTWFRHNTTTSLGSSAGIDNSQDSPLCVIGKTKIKVNESGVATLALNPTGTVLAAASTKGTLIRLFDTKSGDKLNELRRGTAEANIHYLSFDLTGNYLTCCSDRTKIHIYKVQSGSNTKSMFGFSAIAYFVPVAGSEWSVAQYVLREDEVMN